MRFLQLILIAVILPASALPANAQIFGRKKVNPAQRVPELIATVKTDADDRKRSSAVNELGDYDGVSFPEIIPALIDVARNDAKVGVRMEAITTLSHMRPVSQEAGKLIEQAAASDDSLRIRVHARAALLRYQLAGYANAPKMATQAKQVETKPAKKGSTSTEPPLLAPGEVVTASPPRTQAVPVSQSRPIITSTAEPPLATPPLPRPLPQGPPFSTAVPQEPRIITPPVITNNNVLEGPSLTP